MGIFCFKYGCIISERFFSCHRESTFLRPSSLSHTAPLNKYMEEKARMSELSNSESGMEFDTEKIRAVLEEALDFSKPKLDDSIIEKFVSQIIPVDNCRYRWDLNFLPNETQSLVCKVEGRKNHADATIEEGSEDEDESPRTYVLSMDYSNISVTAKNAYQSYVLHRLRSHRRRTDHSRI